MLEAVVRAAVCADPGVKHPEKFHLSLSGCDLARGPVLSGLLICETQVVIILTSYGSYEELNIVIKITF